RSVVVGTLLTSAYAPSLGGLATPVGTAPNLIGLRLLETATGHRASFAQWCAVFAPLAILATVISAAWLGWRTRRAAGGGAPMPSGGPLRRRDPAPAPLDPVPAPDPPSVGAPLAA